ncbi:hypothetical protein BH09MYX1_BH09MYX1_53840 [soil metagenome]
MSTTTESPKEATPTERTYAPPKLVRLGKVSELTGFGGSVTPDGFGNKAPMG